MPLQLPDLDDRKYADLVEEARRLIPTCAPEWTNHNPSDPGITLIELFAYLTEMLLYSLNRVTDDNVRSFLKLLNGAEGWEPSGLEPEALAEDVRTTVLALRRRERAVSGEDCEILALEADPRVARARCIPRRNLVMDLEAERAGHVSVIIVPGRDVEPGAVASVIDAVEDHLEPRRLLTTHLHVLEPQYLPVNVQTTIVPLPDEPLPGEREAGEEDIVERVVNAVKRFLHPLDGGEDGRGWPFGRNVFVSEIYELLDHLPGVDYVTSVNLTADPGRLLEKEGELIGVQIKPYELVQAQITSADVTIQTAS